MDIFNTESKKLKSHIENVSELILKRKLRLCQLVGVDPAEIVVPFTNAENSSLWTENEHWQRVSSNFREGLTINIPNAREFSL